MKPEKTCEWYSTEDEDDIGNYYHSEHVDDGFCLIRDLFTRCDGRCSNYQKAKKENDKEKVNEK